MNRISHNGGISFMRAALGFAVRGYGNTAPNPAVGAVLVKGRKIIGRGWHHAAGLPHAEVEALRDAEAKGNNPRGATLFVTLEPCSTHGRTPPCTDAIKAAGIKRVVVGATDPNPKHSGKGFAILKRAGVQVIHGVMADEANRLNEAFNHWIVRRTPFVTVKAAMTLDGKIATASGESKWITGEKARAYGMKLRQGADAILVGLNTVLADDPALTVREVRGSKFEVQSRKRRIILDSMARTPLKAKIVSDEFRALTTIVVSKDAPKGRVAQLAKRVNVIVAPLRKSKDSLQPAIDLRWLMKKLGGENVTSLLVEGGGEVNASFLLGGLAHRVAFFYAPKILGGRDARKGVAGIGIQKVSQMIKLREVEHKWLGEDLLLLAKLNGNGK
jgi:diaminohydroxyphosphoribosylaminopyrimidine deaminase/5-amino-6-(5-phosphoribosylamino)uracil reductase